MDALTGTLKRVFAALHKFTGSRALRRTPVLVLTSLPFLASCDPSRDRLVIVRYRETMSFNQYQGIPTTGPFGIASYFMITCVSNRGKQAADFTFDVRRISAEDSIGGTRPVVTKDIPSENNWQPPTLKAAQMLVPAGTAINPSLRIDPTTQKPSVDGYGFVVIWKGSMADAEATTKHKLRYAALDNQPVLIVADPNTPSPAYRPAVRDPDFQAGQWQNLPPPAWGTCP